MDDSLSRSPVLEPRKSSSSCKSSEREADDDDQAAVSLTDRVDADDSDRPRCAWCGADVNVDGGGVRQPDESGGIDDECRRVRTGSVHRGQGQSVPFCSAATFDERLSFCSRSCLSRYKMNLFCTETQQYLQQRQVRHSRSYVAF